MEHLLERYQHMVNPKLMIGLTNAMYTSPTEAPSYAELRDMMSSGQLISKLWLIDRLQRVSERVENRMDNILVVGGWYGTLAYFLHKQFPDSRVYSLDLDGRCVSFLRSAFHGIDQIVPMAGDMYDFKYIEGEYDLIVNTACEHIPDVREWLDMLPKNQLVALQANNNDRIDDHINCPQSLREFREMVELPMSEEIGELNFPMYTRYMVIGRT